MSTLKTASPLQHHHIDLVPPYHHPFSPHPFPHIFPSPPRKPDGAPVGSVVEEDDRAQVSGGQGSCQLDLAEARGVHCNSTRRPVAGGPAMASPFRSLIGELANRLSAVPMTFRLGEPWTYVMGSPTGDLGGRYGARPYQPSKSGLLNPGTARQRLRFQGCPQSGRDASGAFFAPSRLRARN